MFTHQQTLDAINAGLRAIGWKELDGIPRAAPQHSEKCVLGCSYKASLADIGVAGGFGVISFEWAGPKSRDLILDAWRKAGVEADAIGTQEIEFRGGLLEWMRAFDGGVWTSLIVEGFDADGFRWDEYPGENTVPVSQIEPEYYAAGLPEAEELDWEIESPEADALANRAVREAPAAGPHPGCAEFADDRDL